MYVETFYKTTAIYHLTLCARLAAFIWKRLFYIYSHLPYHSKPIGTIITSPITKAKMDYSAYPKKASA
jgi:hypothetical protein